MGMKTAKMAVWASLAAMLLATAASADVIQIQLGGVDLRYNGTDIVDTGILSSDPLTNATFIVTDNVNDLTLGVDNTGVKLDLCIPGVFNIPVSGGTVSSAADGNLYLDLGGGEFLSLTLDSAIISYIPLTSTIKFVFVGASSSIEGQQLPYGLSLDDPVSISFSTQIVAPVTTGGGFVTGFVVSGTGEIQAVPEPATMSLLALGALGVLVRRRRNVA